MKRLLLTHLVTDNNKPLNFHFNCL